MKEFKFKVNGNEYTANVKSCDDENMVLELNGKEYAIELEKKEVVAVQARPVIKVPKVVVNNKVEPQKVTAAPGENIPGAVKAPIPGLVVKVMCKVGDAVKAGQTIMILEAMKMQNEIHATANGTIKQLLVKEGDSVLEGAPLASIQ